VCDLDFRHEVMRENQATGVPNLFDPVILRDSECDKAHGVSDLDIHKTVAAKVQVAHAPRSVKIT
jgi:hypothetical protein